MITVWRGIMMQPHYKYRDATSRDAIVKLYNDATVWRNSVTQQCKATVNLYNDATMWRNSVTQQCDATVWRNSVMQQCDATVWRN